MVNILFLPFILFESIISNIANSLNMPSPPRLFSELAQGGNLPMLGPPQIQNFIREATLSNEEIEEVERDTSGFIIRRTIKRVVKEG